MTILPLAIGFAFLALAMGNFARADRTTDVALAKKRRTAGAIFSVGAVAFFVAGALSVLSAGLA